MGVFSTRSPYRPNSLALSCVKLLRVGHEDGKGDYLIVSGADLMNGTPIYDIKPYLPYADSIPDASGGFASDSGKLLNVVADDEALKLLPESKKAGLFEILARDPRPQYHDDSERIYGMAFGGFEIKFRVDGETIYILSAERQ